MKEIVMKRPDITDEKYREQKVITDDAIIQFIVDTDNYIDKLELALYKKSEELEELKEKMSSCRKVERSKLFNRPYGDPMDD